MKTDLDTLLLLSTASSALKDAHDKLLAAGRQDIAAVLHQCAEGVLKATGMIVKRAPEAKVTS